MGDKRFPVLMTPLEWSKWPKCPRSVPWDVVEPHNAQARKNHSQSVERLAERGGLHPIELVAVMEDKEYPCDGVYKDRMKYAVDILTAMAGIEELRAS